MTLTYTPDDVLPLGDPRLHEKCAPVERSELAEAIEQGMALCALILAFREKYGMGRAVAAPQVGYMKRVICMNIDRPLIFINPVLHDLSEEMMELWDDCMCFPDVLVRLRRHRHCKMTFLDTNWVEHTWSFSDDLSELIQHEYDHLEGILATQRAIDERSFALRRYVKAQS